MIGEMPVRFGFVVLLVVAVVPQRLGLGLSHSAGKQAGTDVPSYSRASDRELRKTLSPLQYEVTRENGAEPPFKNE